MDWEGWRLGYSIVCLAALGAGGWDQMSGFMACIMNDGMGGGIMKLFELLL